PHPAGAGVIAATARAEHTLVAAAVAVVVQPVATLEARRDGILARGPVPRRTVLLARATHPDVDRRRRARITALVLAHITRTPLGEFILGATPPERTAIRREHAIVVIAVRPRLAVLPAPVAVGVLAFRRTRLHQQQR